jgi:outer membrane protein assembly factor BamB
LGFQPEAAYLKRADNLVPSPLVCQLAKLAITLKTLNERNGLIAEVDLAILFISSPKRPSDRACGEYNTWHLTEECMEPSCRLSRTSSGLFVPYTFLLAACLLLSGIASAAPSITLSKNVGPPTSKILVSGVGFEPNVGVDIYFDTQDEALVVTDGKGEFSDSKIHAPRSARPGKHWVTALERNNDKGAQDPFVVFTNWPQFLFDDSHAALNRYENILDTRNVGNLTLKWSRLADGSPGYGSPVLANGKIYASCNAGLCAANAATGAVVWTYRASAGIRSTPAVANNVVYIGSADSYLYALDANTGTLLWKYLTGSYNSSPAVANGIVYIGSYDSNVYALNGSSGALVWKYTTGNSVDSSPAVDKGVVYVGSDDGNLYALHAKTGVLLWKFAASGPITSAPAVTNGLVYFASYDENLYAVDANGGFLFWKFGTGSLTYSSPVAADGIVYYAAWTQPIVALEATSGTLLWKIGQGGTGSPAVANGVLYVTSNGNLSAFNARTGSPLWTSFSGSGAETPIVANAIVYVNVWPNGTYAYGLSFAGDNPSARPRLSTLHPDPMLQPLHGVVRR